MTSSLAKAVPARQTKRDRIVDVAIELFTAAQYEDVSVDEVCRRAGVAKGLVFYHFDDKRGLFAAVVERVWEEMIAFQQPRPDEDTPTLRVHGYLHRHFEYVQKYPERFSLLMAADLSSPEVRESVIEIRRRAITTITDGLGCPVHPPPRLRQAIRGYLGFVGAVTVDWLAYHDATVDELVAMCVQSLISAVQGANGRFHDVETELEALAQVSLTAGAWEGGTVKPLSSGGRQVKSRQGKSQTRSTSAPRSQVRKKAAGK